MLGASPFTATEFHFARKVHLLLMIQQAGTSKAGDAVVVLFHSSPGVGGRRYAILFHCV
jgi:hypothetical protein